MLPTRCTSVLILLLVLGGCAPKGAEEYNQGVEQFKQEQFEAAIASLQKAIERNPEFPEAYHSLGVCRLKTGDLPKAREAFDKALELLGEGKHVDTDDRRTVDQKRALAHRHLGLIEETLYEQLMRKDSKTAVEHLRKARAAYVNARELDATEKLYEERIAKIDEFLERMGQ